MRHNSPQVASTHFGRRSSRIDPARVIATEKAGQCAPWTPERTSSEAWELRRPPIWRLRRRATPNEGPCRLLLAMSSYSDFPASDDMAFVRSRSRTDIEYASRL